MTYGFRDVIKSEQKRILRLADLSGPPTKKDRGSLLLKKRGERQYCYENLPGTDGKPQQKYLGTPDSEAARALVKSKFLQEKHRRLMANHELLGEMARRYQDCSFDGVMSALPEKYRAVAFEDFNNERYEELKAWASADYEKNAAPFPNAKIYSQTGERMRSKGECLHANILCGFGVVYRYDCVITVTDTFGNTKKLCPDFLIQCFDGTFIIIEHLGRLFDKGYALSLGEKCYWYLHEGFVLGENFFVTSDDIHGGTDTEAIYRMALEVQRRFFAA